MGKRRNRHRRKRSGKRKQETKYQVNGDQNDENDQSIRETPSKDMYLMRMIRSAPFMLETSRNNLNINTPEPSFTNLNLNESKNSINLNLVFAKVDNRSDENLRKRLSYADMNCFRKIDNNLAEANLENKIKNCEIVKIDVATQTVQYEKTSPILNNWNNYQSMPTFAQIFTTPKITKEINFSPKLSSSSTPIISTKEGSVFKLIEKRTLIQTINKCTPQNQIFKPSTNIININKSFSINKTRLYKSLSPKISKSTFVLFSPAKKRVKPISHGNREIEIPKSFSPIKRTSLRTNENFMNVRSYSKLFSHVRNFHQKYSKKYLHKLFEICSWLGLQMKQGISNLLEISWTRNKGVQVNKPCECKEELSKIYKLLEEINNDVKELKKSSRVIPLVGGAPPPPPPPFNPAMFNVPPPPPLPFAKIVSGDTLKKNTKKPEIKNEESRPVISVEALKSVKLKKPGERCNRSLNIIRRTSQPVISLAMLKQVKLRPASRGLPSSNLSEAASSTLASSPGSSLTKLLAKGGDSSVKRLKRLKRTNTYSSNLDFRNLQGSPRDRERF